MFLFSTAIIFCSTLLKSFDQFVCYLTNHELRHSCAPSYSDAINDSDLKIDMQALPSLGRVLAFKALEKF